MLRPVYLTSYIYSKLSNGSETCLMNDAPSNQFIRTIVVTSVVIESLLLSICGWLAASVGG
ncbi:hypothetical protein PCURB6_22100 [Paenibacillus curdlanolyticus]|nr:hypothetical protein PCURB6_22100 [Paenibacillus curdlanolyticus]